MSNIEIHVTDFCKVLRDQLKSPSNIFTIILNNGVIFNTRPKYDYLNKYSIGLRSVLTSNFSPFKDIRNNYTNNFIVYISEILYIITYDVNDRDSLYKVEHHLLSTFNLNFIKEKEISNFSVFHYIDNNNTIKEYKFNEIYKIPSEEDLEKLEAEMEFIYNCVRKCNTFKTLTDAERYRDYLDYLNNGKLNIFIDYLNQNN